MSQLHYTFMGLSSLEVWYHWEILSIVVYLIGVADVSRSARCSPLVWVHIRHGDQGYHENLVFRKSESLSVNRKPALLSEKAAISSERVVAAEAWSSHAHT